MSESTFPSPASLQSYLPQPVPAPTASPFPNRSEPTRLSEPAEPVITEVPKPRKLRGTINLGGQGVMPSDDYAETITKLRIYCEPDETHGWSLDGYNEDTNELSDDVWHFDTHAEAVAAMPRFLRENGFIL